MLNELQDQQLKLLIEEGKEKGYISFERILEFVDEDSEEYDEFIRVLEKENIEISEKNIEDEVNSDLDDLESDELFEEDLKEDPEFADLSNEIENDLKTKDIDDIVSSIVSPSQADDPIKMYLREIGQIDLLNTTQEITLSSQVQDGLLADQRLKAHSQGKITLSDQEIQECQEIVEYGFQARDILIESNLRLVVSIAKRYLGRGMQFQDLIQEGNMGLMKAVNKFDYTKGFKFSTYATWWIKQAITRAIADQARTIRVPVHMVETINKLARIQRQLTLELNREPSEFELAKKMNMSVDKVRDIYKISQEPVSLETPIGEEDDSHLGDFIKDERNMSPEEYATNELLKDEISEVLLTLTEREEKVIRLRFGLEDGKSRTLEEVGQMFGVTRERIRQIEAKALRKLRHPSRSRKLRDYMTD